MEPASNLICPLCGQANQCLAGTEDITACWCFEVEINRQSLARLPAEQIDKACLCRTCAVIDEARLKGGGKLTVLPGDD